MKRFFSALLIILAGASIYWFVIRKKDKGPKAPKMTPMALKKHSESFNKSVDSIVDAYLDMKNAFVEADSAAAKKAATEFIARLDRLPIEEMKKDTALVLATVQGNVADIRSNAASLLQQTDLTEMRKDFSMVTEMMYPSFFTAINYEGPTLYFTNCPMAFDDSVGANWISNSAAISNPYLGKKDPKYHGGMVTCGSVKDSIVAK